MLIGVRKRFVFIANSKTASTSIERLLTPYAEINRIGSPQRKHISWEDARREYDFLFDQPRYAPDTFFKFGVIRSPVDWVRSWYNYRLANPKVEHPLPAEMTFVSFWRERHDWVKNVRQANSFLDATGKCGMDVLIPLESLSVAMPLVLQRLHLALTPLPRENKSPGNLRLSNIPDDLCDEINAHYADDQELYEIWKERWRDALGGYA